MQHILKIVFVTILSMFMFSHVAMATNYEGDYTACAKQMENGKLIPKLFEIGAYDSVHYVKHNPRNGFYSTDPEYAKEGRFSWVDAYTPQYWVDRVEDIYDRLPQSSIVDPCGCLVMYDLIGDFDRPPGERLYH